MGTFSDCVKRLGIKPEHAAYILQTASEYQQDGLRPRESKIRAVRDLVRETRRQQRSISDQIQKHLDSQSPAPPAQQGSTEPGAGESFLERQPAALPKKEKFTSTKAKQPDLIPDLWRDSLPGQQGLFDEGGGTAVAEPRIMTSQERAQLRSRVDAMRSNVDPETLDDLDMLLENNPEHTQAVLKEADRLADEHNRQNRDTLSEMPTVFGKQWGLLAGLAKRAGAKGKDADGTFKALDQAVQYLRDNPSAAPHVLAAAERLGDGDLEAGLFQVLRGGKAQFTEKTAEDFLPDLVRQAANDLVSFDFGDTLGSEQFMVDRSAPGKRKRQPVTTAKIKRLYPGAKVRQMSPTSWSVQLPNKRVFAIHSFPNIRPTPEYAAKIRERYPHIPDAQWANIEAAGVHFVVTRNGQAINVVGLSVDGGADTKTLSHESVHLARNMGLWTDEEWSALAEKYGQNLTGDTTIEEAIAMAAESRAPGLRRKIKDFLKKILSLFGFDKFSPDALDLMRTEEFWSRQPRQRRSGVGAESFQLKSRKEKPAERWYSKARRVIESKMSPKAPPNQVLSMLEKNGVKPEEIEWMGLKELLGATNGAPSVTKEQVLAAIDGGVKIEEVVLGDKSKYSRDDIREQAINDIREVLGRSSGGIPAEVDDAADRWLADSQDIEAYDTLDDAMRSRGEPGIEAMLQQAEDHLPAIRGERTKFSQYTLPGGENYRELLLTLPTKRHSAQIIQVEGGHWAIQHSDGSRSRYPFTSREAAERELAAYQKREDSGERTDATTYRSSHFDEPNVLAHIRFNERTDVDGKKVLFIEEIQSDWHQEGRKKGYSNANLPSILKEQESIDSRLRAIWSELQDIVRTAREKVDSGNFPSTRDEFNARNELAQLGNVSYAVQSQRKKFSEILPEQSAHIQNKLKSLAEEHDGLHDRWESLDSQLTQSRHSVPNAPFKKTWPLLAMKRAIQWAAENGFDRIAWTTGEQQAERYDLSKQLSDIQYEPINDPPNTYEFFAHDKGGREVIHEDEATLERIEEVAGKEIAQKIANREGVKDDSSPYREWYTLSGLDLKIGGEGMKAFYDQMLPNEVNKFVKKFGAKVGKSNIVTSAEGIANDIDASGMAKYTPETTAAHSFDITPAMQESALGEGQPMFQLKSRDPEVQRKLANFGWEPYQRQILKELDRAATAAGEPGYVSEAEQYAEAKRRLEKDAEGVQNRVLTGQMLDPADTVAAHELWRRAADRADADPEDTASRDLYVKLRNAYRMGRTDLARAMAIGHDPLAGRSVEEATDDQRYDLLRGLLADLPDDLFHKWEAAKKSGDAEEVQRIERKHQTILEGQDDLLRSIGVDPSGLREVAKSPRATRRVLRELQAAKSTFWDKVVEYRSSFGLFSGPMSHAANIGSNAFNGVLRYVIERPLEAAINEGMMAIGAGDPMGARLEELPHVYRAMYRGVVPALKNAILSFDTERPITLARTDKFDTRVGAIGGKLGRTVRAPGYRALTAEDEFFNAWFAAAEHAGIAYRLAKLQNMPASEIEQYIAEETSNYFEDTPVQQQMEFAADTPRKERLSWRLAKAEAATLTMNQELQGGAKKALKAAHAMQGITAYGVPLGRFALPVVSFPIRGLTVAMRKAPITGDVALMANLVQRALKNRADGKHWSHGMSEGMAKRLAERVVASSVLLVLAAAVDDEDPWITGTKATSPSGYPRTSIKLGDTWYNYGRIEPFATAFGLTVDGLMRLKGAAGLTASDTISLPLGQIHEKSFLASLSDILNAGEMLARGEVDASTASLGRMASRFGESFYPAFLRQAGSATQGKQLQYRTWGDSSEIASKRRKANLGIPGKYPLLYSPWGKPLDKSEAPFWSAPLTDTMWRLVTPAQSTTSQPTVGDRIIASYRANTKNPKGVNLEPPKPEYTVNGQRYFMSDDQFEKYQREAGELADRIVTQWASVNASGVLDGTTPATQQQFEYVKDVLSQARSAVKKKMIADITGTTTYFNRRLRNATVGKRTGDLTKQINQAILASP